MPQRLTLVVLACLLAAACASEPPDFTITRAEVEVRVQPHGGADVVENWVVAPGSRPVDLVREPGAYRFDGISDIHGEVAGPPPAVQPGQSRIDAGASTDLIARWVIDPAPSGPVNLRVRYRIHGLVGVAGLRGSLRWSAFGPGLDAPISRAVLTLILPEDAALINDPHVEEPGWTVVRTPRGMIASRDSVPANSTATIGAEFVVDHLSTAQPRWQFEAARASEFVPAFISAGLFILVIGAGVIGMIHFRFTRGDSVDTAGAQRRMERETAARDLSRSGFIALGFGILALFATARLPGGFGPWSYAIAVSVVLVGLAFIAAAPLFRPR